MTNDPVSQWQPVSTAPHDENILVFSARHGTMVAAFRSEFAAWFAQTQRPASLGDEESEFITHWMPLPPTPTAPQRCLNARPAPATGLPPSLALP